jgi:Protein of unknown function (DUF3551)
MRLSLVVFGVAVAATTNCGFSTLQQCQADVSGLGGFCESNNSYVPPQSATPAPRRPRKTS